MTTYTSKTKPKPIKKIALITLGTILSCCTGTAILGALLPDEKPASSASQQQPFLAASPAEPATTPTSTATTTKPAAKRTTAAARKAAPKPAATSHKPTPKPRPKKTTQQPAQPVVRPGAFCSPEGARGRTSKGTPMKCSRKPGQDRARWRSA